METTAGMGAGATMGGMTYQSSGTYYYTGTGSVANVTGSATNQSYSYTTGGSMTAFAMSASAGTTSDTTSTLTTNLTAYGTYGVYGYNGEYTHTGLGLQYLRARYLNVATGTFTSRDTYAGRMQDILSQNRYTYAENNPVGHSDPSGHAVTHGNKAARGFNQQTTMSTAERARQATQNSVKNYAQTQRLNNMTTTERAVSATQNSINSYIKEKRQSLQPNISIPNVGVGRDDIVALQWSDSVVHQIEQKMCAAYGYCTNETQTNILKEFGHFLGEIEIVKYTSVTTMISSLIWDEWATNTELSSSVAYGGRLSGSYGLIIDSEGNVAISRTANAGGGTPSVGSSISQTIVGNIDYSNYGGWGGNIGGSVNVGPTPIAVGGDVVIMAEGENEKNGHMGLSGNVGLSLPMSGVPLEVHGEANYTRILGHVNIYTGEFSIGVNDEYEGNIYDGTIRQTEKTD